MTTNPADPSQGQPMQGAGQPQPAATGQQTGQQSSGQGGGQPQPQVQPAAGQPAGGQPMPTQQQPAQQQPMQQGGQVQQPAYNPPMGQPMQQQPGMQGQQPMQQVQMPQGAYYPPMGQPMQGQQPNMQQPVQQMPQQGQMPQGAYYPPMGQPMQPGMGMPYGGGMPPMGQPGMGGAQPQDEDNTPANFQLGTKLPPVLKVKVPANPLKFDEPYFVKLLAGSISLTKDEKKKIVESVPKLRQSQVDELIRIFEEEKRKFAALSKKHVPQLEKLAQQHYDDWMDLEKEVEANEKKSEEQAKAEEIRKNLGL